MDIFDVPATVAPPTPKDGFVPDTLWWNTVTTVPFRPRDWTAEEILRACRQLREVAAQNRPEFDCVACLPETYEKMRRLWPLAGPSIVGTSAAFDVLGGVPVYVVGSRAEAVALAVKLAEDGQRLKWVEG